MCIYNICICIIFRGDVCDFYIYVCLRVSVCLSSMPLYLNVDIFDILVNTNDFAYIL